MKYIKTLLFAIKIFDIIPLFILKIICFPFKRNYSLEINADEHAVMNFKKNSVLIWLDYSNAIGDFFSILKVIIQFDKLNIKYSLMVSRKFFGIIESLNFRNANIIYKENSLGSHYQKNGEIDKNINLINKEFLNKKLVFDKIYYFNGILLTDALTAINNIRYNKIFMIDPKIFLRGRHSKFIDRNHISLSLFYLINMKKFRIEIIKNKKYKDASISYIISDFMGVDIDENKLTNYEINNDIIISSGASNPTKVLIDYELEKILKFHKLDGRKIFVGSPHDNKFIFNLINSNEYLFYSNLTLFELFDLVKKSKMIISYDTGLYHMAKFYEKEILLILNKNDFAYKYMKNYWIGKISISETRIILSKQNFYK